MEVVILVSVVKTSHSWSIDDKVWSSQDRLKRYNPNQYMYSPGWVLQKCSSNRNFQCSRILSMILFKGSVLYFYRSIILGRIFELTSTYQIRENFGQMLSPYELYVESSKLVATSPPSLPYSGETGTKGKPSTLGKPQTISLRFYVWQPLLWCVFVRSRGCKISTAKFLSGPSNDEGVPNWQPIRTSKHKTPPYVLSSWNMGLISRLKLPAMWLTVYLQVREYNIALANIGSWMRTQLYFN